MTNAKVGPESTSAETPRPDPAAVDTNGHEATEVLTPATELVTPQPEKRSGLRRLRRIVLLLAVVGAVVAGVFYGWPIVDERVIQPIRNNTSSVSAVQNRVDTAETRLAELQSQLEAIIAAEAVVPDRLTALEEGMAAVGTAQSEMDTRLGSVESLVGGHTQQLGLLDDLQKALDSDVTAAGEAASRQVSQLKAMELMSRARLFLYQANYGLAEADIVAARDLIAANQPGVDDAETALNAELLLRLDKAAAALPELPVVAADDLDIAWQLLLGGVAPPAG